MSKPSKYHLPGVLGLIASEVGEDVAVKLAKARGGRVIFVHHKPTENSVLAVIVGLEPARAIAKLLGRGSVMVPCGNIGGAGGRRARIEAMWRTGASHSEIAATVDVHLRTVERIVAGLRDDAQLNFPFQP